MRTWTTRLLIGLAATTLVHGCVIDTVDDCYDDGSCVAPGGSGPMGGGGSSTSDGGSGAAGGSTGGGGMAECVDHVDCTMAGAAQCDAGTCVACTDDDHCQGVDGLGVCDDGECVECGLNKEAACNNATQTCSLLDHECVDVPPNDLGTCEPCNNDSQCMNGNCVPFNFDGMPHGYFCLAESGGSCALERPYGVVVMKTSINETPVTSYCGINEELATCEAVRAHLAIWTCSGTDGMCLPTNAMTEVRVPGALCRTVGGNQNRCTYDCDGAIQCTTTANEDTCGDGDMTPPGWCGG